MHIYILSTADKSVVRLRTPVFLFWVITGPS